MVSSAKVLLSSPPPPDVSWKARGITNLTVEIPSSLKLPTTLILRPSRWYTKEFIFYAVAFMIAIPYMILSVVNLSSTSHPNYPSYQHRLSAGWLFHREIDNSDTQYRSFRNNIPSLFLFSAVHLGVGALYDSLFRSNTEAKNRRSLFMAFTAIATIFALHGASAVKILIIITLNFYIAKRGRSSRVGIWATWIFNIAVLFSNEMYDGYRFGAIYPRLEPLDSIRGFYPRWNVSFNITVLRLISFNLDHYWACDADQTADPGLYMDERARASTSHPESTYNYTNYLAYTLYPPLYIAGPIMTFNDFVWQVQRPLQMFIRGRLAYFLRFVVSLLTMECVLHFMYVVAIKDAKAWSGDTPFELTMVGFWNLNMVWLKLLIPWRFFRLWALLDGIDPPENMVRCVSNNYSTLGFWRSWHRSYNMWLLRYIYIPIGGSSSAILPKLLVFTFVALWHDLSMRLLAWGWLVSLFILPELLARHLLPESRYGSKSWYRHVCALGGVINIVMMMSANLVGFVLGTEGMSHLASQVFTTWAGVKFLLVGLPCLFIGVQVMFEYRYVTGWIIALPPHAYLDASSTNSREEEKRRGISRKC